MSKIEHTTHKIGHATDKIGHGTHKIGHATYKIGHATHKIKDHLSEVTYCLGYFGSIENLTLPEDSSYPEIFINLAFNFRNSLFKTLNLYLLEVNISLKIISPFSFLLKDRVRKNFKAWWGTYINFRELKEEKNLAIWSPKSSKKNSPTLGFVTFHIENNTFFPMSSVNDIYSLSSDWISKFLAIFCYISWF